ncbi:MAG: alpha/beta hydrolase domain-containing protein [Gemmatimonadota bacterium]|nr:alpha/beta hydrolase domain-containing protein [Gemmatimonadota bacterium]MDH3421996.1 alpha/beta hydrolase domain-containing protein [Gemmatimonadota bacterium]
MTTRHAVPFLTAAICLPLFAVEVAGQITRLDIDVVESPALDGTSFGDVGRYERLRGTAFGEVDPADPRHRDIVNIDRAPRNARGRVEYSTTVEIYRPIDMARWNRAIYHTVPNRGGAGAGDRVLLDMGFALVRVGWQGDLVPNDRNVVPTLPVARNADGTPIVGPALEEFIFNDDDPVSQGRLSYPTATLEPSRATLTVRRNLTSPRVTPADLRWRFTNPTEIRIERPAGFDGGAIYEFVYEAKDPVVMGLGFVAMRDAISFLRYREADDVGNANPLASPGLASVAISFGNSQSGRYQRDMLYQGFNEDVQGRIVFDGIHPHIAGSRKTFTNYQFSQPGRWQKQHEDHFYPGDQFPFTYATLTDPITGRTDGLQVRCSRTNTCPKIIHTDGEAEVYQGRSSLIVTDPVGGHIELPDNVRAYIIAGTRHGGGRGVFTETDRGICQNLNSPMPISEIQTALTVALYDWVVAGTPPPASRFPTVENGGLVPASSLSFPHIPGVMFSGSYNPLEARDFSSIPPTSGDAYTVLVGRVDADGNMVDGIKHPHLAVPLGTYTGWNLRREGFGSGGQCAGSGSYIPFASTRAEREASGDPRLSIEERYASPQMYVYAVAGKAGALVNERLLLPTDAEEIIEETEETLVRR